LTSKSLTLMWLQSEPRGGSSISTINSSLTLTSIFTNGCSPGSTSLQTSFTAMIKLQQLPLNRSYQLKTEWCSSIRSNKRYSNASW
jgi:hypothetical protein